VLTDLPLAQINAVLLEVRWEVQAWAVVASIRLVGSQLSIA